MELMPHQQRVVEEKAELDAKLVKLNAFFNTDIFAGIDGEEQNRLRRQASHMADYSEVLAERISAFIK